MSGDALDLRDGAAENPGTVDPAAHPPAAAPAPLVDETSTAAAPLPLGYAPPGSSPRTAGVLGTRTRRSAFSFLTGLFLNGVTMLVGYALHYRTRRVASAPEYQLA